MSDHEQGDRLAAKLLLKQADRSEGLESHVLRAPSRPEVTDRVSCRLGDGSCAARHAVSLRRWPAAGSRSNSYLLHLQRHYGNRYVGRVLSRMPAGDDTAFEGVERSIDQARGGGQGLDHGVRKQMESSFGADFGGVRIHTDERADSLNHSLSARAFATGQDIFFRQGEFNPGSTAGRELLAHELTHVVQQGGAPIKAKLTVSQPDDAHELEADRVAKAVIERETQPTGTPEEDKDKEVGRKRDGIARQPEGPKPEDEEEAKQR